jgi:hypothetical protein
MKTILTICSLALAVQTVQAQKGTSCTNPGIQWVINGIYVDGTTASAIQGDGAPYVNGESGVTAVVNVCSGTYDATLLLSRPRTLSFSFARALATNSNTPSWALSGSTQTGAGFLNVRNIFYVPSGSSRNAEYTFSTRFGSNPPASGSPDFRMLNPSAEAPAAGAGSEVSLSNSPYPDSLIIVHHCPANTNTSTCPNITSETWFAYPDPNPTASGTGQTGLPISQVGALLVSSKGTLVNAGEFSVPFLFAISLLQ